MSPNLPSKILDKDWRSSWGSHLQWMIPRFARRTLSPCEDAHRFLFLMWGRKNRSATVTLEREREGETRRRKYRKCKVIIGTIKNIVSSKWPIHCDDSAVLGCYLEPAVIRWQPTSVMARETALKVRAEAALRFWLGDFEREKFVQVALLLPRVCPFLELKNVVKNMGSVQWVCHFLFSLLRHFVHIPACFLRASR